MILASNPPNSGPTIALVVVVLAVFAAVMLVWLHCSGKIDL